MIYVIRLIGNCQYDETRNINRAVFAHTMNAINKLIISFPGSLQFNHETIHKTYT